MFQNLIDLKWSSDPAYIRICSSHRSIHVDTVVIQNFLTYVAQSAATTDALDEAHPRGGRLSRFKGRRLQLEGSLDGNRVNEGYLDYFIYNLQSRHSSPT